LELGTWNLESAAERRWWVIHTRPRCEKKMDAWLAQQNMPHFLPTRPRLRIYKSKRVTFDHPLFSGYSFGSFSPLEQQSVFGSNHAAALLEVNDQKRLLRELDIIRLALDSGAELEECPFLAEGSRARIVSGKLRGLEGVVRRRSGKTKMILSVELLQRSVDLEIEPAWLELAG
jgi:transcription antitermination factor NusG